MLKGVLFDIDGTLLDSVDQHARAWQEALQHFGFDIPLHHIRAQIGKGGDKLLETLLSKQDVEVRGKELEQFRADLFKRKYLSSCKPFPDVPELLEHIKADGLKIALASSAKKDEIAVYEKMLGISRLIDGATSSDDVDSSKPDPDILDGARKKIGNLAPAVCVFIGDSPHDGEAAKRDHMPMIGVLCGGFPERDLRKTGARAIFQDPADLLRNWDRARAAAEQPPA